MTGTAVRQQYVTSADGTRISVTITGDGPPLVVCPGALAIAQDWQSVADTLAPRMTTYAVDRRGHGASGDGPAFSIEREQQDLASVLELAGTDAVLLGHSYGALIALGVALQRPPARLVIYEPPLPLDGPVGGAAVEDYAAAIREGDIEKALTLGMREFVGLSEDAIAAFRQQPIWPRLAAMAPSLTRELRAVDRFDGDLDRFRAISVPVLLIVGAVSPTWLRNVSFRLAAVIPGAAVAEIPGQAHDAHLFGAEAIAGTIAQFAL
jgi:pimeloyl-ACP methyl ester carboxylesterase